MPATKTKKEKKRSAISPAAPGPMNDQERAAMAAAREGGQHETNLDADLAQLEEDSLDAASKVQDFADSVSHPGPRRASPRELLCPMLPVKPGQYMASQINVQLQKPEERQALASLFRFLDVNHERIRYRSSDPDAAARPVTSKADAIRWLLQNLHRVRIVPAKE